MVTQVRWDAQTKANLARWLEGDYDAATKAELRRLMEEEPAALADAFYTSLRFGTAGLRGVMGLGTNRINQYTVKEATQGLANYLKKTCGHQPKVLIGYDSRHHSRDFASETARVLAGNGIVALIFKELRPVPLISFGVLELNCDAGVMITASHNPPEYNGYKVYWQHGGQVLPPHDMGIIDEVNAIMGPSQVLASPESDSHIHWVDDRLDVAYLNATRGLQAFRGQNQARGHELHAVYTALHGSGITLVPAILRDWGFTQVVGVAVQNDPDGDFPTVTAPNPEDPAAMKLGVAQMNDTGADVLLATDPDADRVGVVVKHAGQPVYLDGNQIACLVFDHFAGILASEGRLPPAPIAVKSVVTSELYRAIAAHYNIGCIDVLTGFKYIGELIDQMKEHFVFGAEESYGCLAGTHARDKDAVVTCALICELALDCKLQGQTLIDRLHALYQCHGVYREQVTALTFKGQQGATHMEHLMARLRTHPPKEIGGVAVETIEDYQQETHLPRANVIRLWLTDGSTVVIRPSGTEPKVKIYCGSRLPAAKPLEETIAAADARNTEIIDAIKSAFV